MFSCIIGIFVLLPAILKRVVNKSVISLKAGDTVVCDKRILAKRDYTDKDSTNTRNYFVKVPLDMNGSIKTQEVRTDSRSYGKLQVGDVCCVVWFKTGPYEKIKHTYLTAFDPWYSAAREYYEQLNGKNL